MKVKLIDTAKLKGNCGKKNAIELSIQTNDSNEPILLVNQMHATIMTTFKKIIKKEIQKQFARATIWISLKNL